MEQGVVIAICYLAFFLVLVFLGTVIGEVLSVIAERIRQGGRKP